MKLNHMKLYEDFDLGNIFSKSKSGTVPLYFRGDEVKWFEIDDVNKYNNIFRFNLGYYTPDYEMKIDLDYDPISKVINFYDLKVDGRKSSTRVSETEKTISYLDKNLYKKGTTKKTKKWAEPDPLLITSEKRRFNY